jgi:hypothetical protein
MTPSLITYPGYRFPAAPNGVAEHVIPFQVGPTWCYRPLERHWSGAYLGNVGWRFGLIAQKQDSNEY